MATKTFKHAVIYNGEFYPANTPIKVNEPTTREEEPIKKAVVKNDKGANRKA